MTVDCLLVSCARLGLGAEIHRYWDMSEEVERSLSGQIPLRADGGFSGVTRLIHGLDAALAPVATGARADARLLQRCARQARLAGRDGRLLGPVRRQVETLAMVVATYTEDDPVPNWQALTADTWWTDSPRYPVRALAVAATLRAARTLGELNDDDVELARSLHDRLEAPTIPIGGAFLLAGSERVALESRLHGEGRPSQLIEAINRHVARVGDHVRAGREALNSAVATQVGAELLRRENVQLYQAARTDALTATGSRHHLEETMSRRALEPGRSLGVIIVDVDNFKQINDEHGHLLGDRVLRRVADLMRSCMRRDGDEVFRYGGDEFVALLPGISERACAHRASRVQEAVAAQDWGTVHPSLQVTITVGSSAGSGPAHALFERADRALLSAKASRREGTSARSNGSGDRSVSRPTSDTEPHDTG